MHEYGSSHGLTRIIRLAYWEHPTYVALLRRAYELWRELEGLAGERLLHITGSVDAGPEGGAIFEGARKSSELHGLAHEVMDGAELHRRFPGYRLPKEIRCLYQPEGGFLLPERCDVAQVEQALAHGAEVRCREPVLEWEAKGGRVRVRTTRGRYEAGRLVDLRGALGVPARPRAAGTGGARAAGARVASACQARVLPPGRLPRVQLGGGGRPVLRVPQLSRPRVQVRQVPSPGRAGGPRLREPRARAGGRGAAAGLRPTVLPRGRRTDADAQGVPLHQQPGPPLHPGPAPGAPGGRRSPPGSPATATSSAASSAR